MVNAEQWKINIPHRSSSSPSTSPEFWLPLPFIYALLFGSFRGLCRALFRDFKWPLCNEVLAIFPLSISILFIYRVRLLDFSPLVLSSVPFGVLAFLGIFLPYTCLGLDLFEVRFGAASAYRPLDGLYKYFGRLYSVYRRFWDQIKSFRFRTSFS